MFFPLRFAHEVYVLDRHEIAGATRETSIHILDTLKLPGNLGLFLIYAGSIGLMLMLVLFLKSLSNFQKAGKFIDKSTRFVPDFIRIVFGASLIFSATYNSMFGPELPLSIFPAPNFLKGLMFILGGALILGIATRALGALAAGLWLFTLVDQGWYMLTYINYFGEALALVLLPRQVFSLDRVWSKWHQTKPSTFLASEDWAMPVARLLLGFSVLYAAVNVKFVTSALSLDVVNSYDLTRYFHFDPLFIVLGAGFVEALIAVLYLLGLAQRFNSIIFIAFMTISIVFFKETVWPHYLLIGLAIGIFLHRPDKLALDRYLFSPIARKKRRAGAHHR